MQDLSAYSIELLKEEDYEEAYQLLNFQLAEKLKGSYYDFFKEFWPVIESVDLQDNWHIKYICERLQKHYLEWENGGSPGDIVINLPPGSSKSRLVTIMLNAWVWCRNPSVRFLTSSYSSEISIELAVKI